MCNHNGEIFFSATNVSRASFLRVFLCIATGIKATFFHVAVVVLTTFRAHLLAIRVLELFDICASFCFIASGPFGVSSLPLVRVKAKARPAPRMVSISIAFVRLEILIALRLPALRTGFFLPSQPPKLIRCFLAGSRSESDLSGGHPIPLSVLQGELISRRYLRQD